MTIVRDLAKKLDEDLVRAIFQYRALCKAMDVDAREAALELVTSLLNCTASMAIATTEGDAEAIEAFGGAFVEAMQSKQRRAVAAGLRS